MHQRGAAEVEKRLIDGERFDQRRQRHHRLANFAADANIFGHVGTYDDRRRAEIECLEHRHRRAHAVGARDITGRRYHAAFAAADDDRLVSDVRVIALLHGGIERVAIDMGERQRCECPMPDEARRAAFRAAHRLRRGVRQTVAAKSLRIGGRAVAQRVTPSAGPAPRARL